MKLSSINTLTYALFIIVIASTNFSVLCSCNDRINTETIDDKLLALDAAINVNTDSAFQALKCIDANTLSYKNLAYWTYLKTRAANMAQKPITWKNEIIWACDYYEKNCTAEETAMAYYYLAKTHESENNIKAATTSLLKSLQFQNLNKPTQLLTFTYLGLSEYYQRNRLYPEALQYALKAEDITNIINDKQIYCAVFNQLTECYHLLNDDKNSKRYLYKALETAKMTNNNLLLSNGYDMLSNLFQNDYQYDSALFYKNIAIQFHPQRTSMGHLHLGKAFIYENLNKLDSAIFYLNLVIMEDQRSFMQATAYNRLAEIAKKTGKQKTAMIMTDSAHLFLSQENNEKVEADLLRIKYEQEKQNLLSELNNKDNVILMFITIICIFILLSFIEFHYKMRNKKKAILKTKTNIPKQAKDYSLFNNNINDNSNLNTTQLTLDEIKQSQIKFQQTESYDLLLQLATDKTLELKSNQVMVLRKDIESSFYNCFITIRNINPNISKEECLTLALLIMNFSIKVISKALCCNEDATRKRRLRLRGKIDENSMPILSKSLK